MPDSTHFDIPYVGDRASPLAAALAECEEFCVAACCGMDAFNITSKRLQRWADGVPVADVDEARRQTAEILAKLKDAPDKFFFLDCEHSRGQITGWFQSIQEALAEVKAGGVGRV